MRVFFLSDRPCMLTVGGLCLGSVDGHERCAELDPSDSLLCEFKCPAFHPILFVFDEAFLINPPHHVRIYYTKNGIAVYVHGFLRDDATLRLCRQIRLANTLLTLYVQGRVQLSLENETGFHLIDLPDSMEHAEIKEAGDLYLIEAISEFCLVNREGALVVRSEGKVTACARTVTAEVPFHDSLGHTALCSWTEGNLTACSIRAAAQPTEATYALALFESVLIGADSAPYLADSLLEKADALRDYLGAFISVVLTGRHDEIGLVYERKERVFDVRYFRVTLQEDGKISNITPKE